MLVQDLDYRYCLAIFQLCRSRQDKVTIVTLELVFVSVYDVLQHLLILPESSYMKEGLMEYKRDKYNYRHYLRKRK